MALFCVDTTDEIVIDTATGGRTTYKNAGKTRRRGVEAEWEGDLGDGLRGLRGVHLPVGEIRVAPTTGLAAADHSRPARGCPACRAPARMPS